MSDNLERVVIFGPVGSGKTTLVNLLIDEKFETSDGGYSCTRKVQEAQCRYFPFYIVDFPGTDSSVDKIQHLQAQETALKSNHFKVIVLTCALTSRLDDFTHRLYKIKNLFSHHLKNVVVIVTHCDSFSLENQDKAKRAIKQDLGFTDVFFKSANTEALTIAAWINSFVQNSKMKRVEVGEGIFEGYKLSGLIIEDILDTKVVQIRSENIDNFKRIYHATLELFNSKDSDADLKRALYFSLKQHMDEIADKHAKQVAPSLTDKSKLTVEVMTFQNSLMNLFNEFKTMVIRDITVENTVYNTATPQYKECPKCNNIWFRVYGCDSIICGRRSVSMDFNNHKFYNYTIQWVKDKLFCQRIEVNKTNMQFAATDRVGLSDEEQKKNALRAAEGKPLIKPVGCGENLEWSKMKDVTHTVAGDLKSIDFDLTSETYNIVEKHESEVTTLNFEPPVATPQKNTALFRIYSVDQVAEWLTKIGFSKLVDKFKEEQIDGKALLDLSEDDLKKDFGMKIGEVKRLLRSMCE